MQELLQVSAGSRLSADETKRSLMKQFERHGSSTQQSSNVRNPAWRGFLDALIKQAIQDLGVQVPVSAHPYKLLLYEEGAFFKAHRDTEKVPGMFETLVVCLPSLHAGGEVLLTHSKKQHKIETADDSEFGLSALAWYSDVQHEIRPITSGYRLVLTYNLVQDETLPKQTAAALDVSHAKL